MNKYVWFAGALAVGSIIGVAIAGYQGKAV